MRYFEYLGFQLLKFLSPEFKIIKAANLEGFTGEHVQRELNL